jgi:uncharacterized protein YjiS (DUF1127 family)
MSYLSALFRRAERNKALSDLMKLDDHLLRDIGLTRTDITAMYRTRPHASPSRGHE